VKKAPPSSPCSLFSLLVRRRFLSEILRLQIESLSEKEMGILLPNTRPRLAVGSGWVMHYPTWIGSGSGTRSRDPSQGTGFRLVFRHILDMEALGEVLVLFKTSLIHERHMEVFIRYPQYLF
jgi:hypothetical protein